MNRFNRLFAAALVAGAFVAAALVRADSPSDPDNTFVPPTPEQMQAAGLLPKDEVMPPGHHKLLDRWTKAWGLSDEQRLWIEPQLHAEESVTKPILSYKALSREDRKRILDIIKVAARNQVRILLTPHQRKLMDAEIKETENGG